MRRGNTHHERYIEGTITYLDPDRDQRTSFLSFISRRRRSYIQNTSPGAFKMKLM